jgi:hypothetical protein
MCSKTRQQHIYIGSDQPFNRVLTSGDSFSLPDDGHTYWVFHQREYQRATKPKILYALFQFFGSRSIKLDPAQELRKYDAIFAIDTNYKSVAVTTAVVGTWVPKWSIFETRKLFTRSFVPVTSVPEREAWHQFLSEANASSSTRICLVVDSDLGALMKINRLEQPIVPGYYLPPNWQLNYATSDVNDPFIMVKMMRLCDRANRRAARLAVSHGTTI